MPLKENGLIKLRSIHYGIFTISCVCGLRCQLVRLWRWRKTLIIDWNH